MSRWGAVTVEYLEQIATEWYEYQGYFVHRDLWIGLQSDGTYECELDIVAFHPMRHHLVQIETSLDLLDWTAREEHFRVKFEAARKYLHRMFGVQAHLEQIALMVTDDGTHRSIAGGKIVRLSDLLVEVMQRLCSFDMAESAVPEQWPLLRTLQFVAAYRDRLGPVLIADAGVGPVSQAKTAR
jgi:hypothetical protein